MSRAKSTPVLIWTFPDGRTVRQPLWEHDEQLVRQYAAMAASDDPVLRGAGERRMRETAQRLADHTASKQLGTKIAASAPRPQARNQLRQRIVGMMRTERQGGVEFKVLLTRWEREQISGLSLASVAANFMIEDDETGDRRQYTMNSLIKLFSEAGK